MTIHALFFAHYQDITGERAKTLALPDGATVADLLTVLQRDYPALDNVLAYGRVAVNLEFADGTQILSDGDEVGLMPPMSGGCC